MSNARVALAEIANRVLDTYNTNERWVVKIRSQSVLIELLPFYQLFTRRIRCNILTVNLL